METALKQEKLLSTLMKPRPKSEEAISLVEKSFFGFKNDKKSLDGMRREYASDTTGMHPKFPGLKIDRKAYSMGILHEDRPHVNEDGNTVDQEHSDEVQIQIDSAEPSADISNAEGESGEMNGKPNNPVSLTDFVPIQPVAQGAQAVGDAFVRLGSFTKKAFADEQEEEDETASKKKKIDPVTKAKQLERLNRLERYMRKEQIQVTFRDTLNQVENATIDHRSVKKLATFLFWNIKHDVEAREISRDDVGVFFDKEEDTDRAFAMLDSDGDGSICMKDCISAVERIYSERCNLASTLRDTKAITNVLEFLIGLVIHTIFIFFYLMIMGADVSQIWVGFTGLLVSFSFIFATTVSNVFQNIIFLFGVHAYDIGDTLLINNQYLTVDEITINYTCCVSGYNLKVWFPNTALQSNLFVNLTTSGTKWDVIYVYVDIDTDPSILDKIEKACAEVRQEKKGEYGPGFRVKFGSAAMPYKVGIEMVYEYSHQGINFHRTACARSWMYETFCRILTENNVQFTWPETKRSTDLDFTGWGPANVVQGQTDDSSRGGRSNLQSDIFQQQN
jgi:small-conductance mechanosensitive channel